MSGIKPEPVPSFDDAWNAPAAAPEAQAVPSFDEAWGEQEPGLVEKVKAGAQKVAAGAEKLAAGVQKVVPSPGAAFKAAESVFPRLTQPMRGFIEDPGVRTIGRAAVEGVKELPETVKGLAKEAAHGVSETAKAVVGGPYSPEFAGHVTEAAKIGVNFLKWPTETITDVIALNANLIDGSITQEDYDAQLTNITKGLVGLVGFKVAEAGYGEVKAAIREKATRIRAEEAYYRARPRTVESRVDLPIEPERQLGAGAPPPKGAPPSAPPGAPPAPEAPVPTLAQMAKESIDKLAAEKKATAAKAGMTGYHRWEGLGPEQRAAQFPTLAKVAAKPWRELNKDQRKLVRTAVEAEQDAAALPVTPEAKAAARPPISQLTPEQIAKFGTETAPTPGIPRPSELEAQLPPEHQTSRGTLDYTGPPRRPPPPSGLKPTGVEEIGRGKLTQAEFEAANEAQKQKQTRLKVGTKPPPLEPAPKNYSLKAGPGYVPTVEVIKDASKAIGKEALRLEAVEIQKQGVPVHMALEEAARMVMTRQQASIAGMGKAITGNMYEALFKAHQAGQTKVAGVRDPILVEARKQGLKFATADELRTWANTKYSGASAQAPPMPPVSPTAGAAGGTPEVPPQALPARRAEGPPSVQDVIKDLEDDIISQMITGEGLVGAGMDPSLVQKLGHDLYEGKVAGVVAKEGVQNAIDATRGPSGRGVPGKGVIVSVNNEGRTISFADNGHGMTPQVAQFQFMDVGGTKKLTEDPSGGYGLAKVGLLANAEHFHMETVAEVEGKKIRSNISGSGKDWMEGKLKFTSRDAGKDESTGTVLTIKFPKDIGFEGYQAQAVLQNLGQYSRADLSIKSTNRFIETERLPTTDVIETHETPGANIDVMYSAEMEEGRVVTVHVLNNGLYQFSEREYLENDVRMPKFVTLDVRPKKGAGKGDYPFTTSREKLKSGAEVVLKKVATEVAQESGKLSLQILIDRMNDAPLIEGSEKHLQMYDTQGDHVDYLEDAAKSEHAGPLADDMSWVIYKIARELTAAAEQVSTGKVKTYHNFDFGGLSISPGYLGLNIHGELLTKFAKEVGSPFFKVKNTIIVNPYVIYREILRAAQTGERPDTPLSMKLAEHTFGTLVHEIIHESARKHNELFSGDFTRALGVVFSSELRVISAHGVGKSLILHLNRMWEKTLLTDFTDFYDQLSRKWVKGDDPFQSVSSDVGYFGRHGELGPEGGAEPPGGEGIFGLGGEFRAEPEGGLREGEVPSGGQGEGTAVRGAAGTGDAAAARVAELKARLETTTDVVEKINILNELRNISEGIFVPPKAPEAVAPAAAAAPPAPAEAAPPAPVEAPTEPLPPPAPESQLALIDSRGPLYTKTLDELDQLLDQLDALLNPDKRALGDDYLRISAAKRIVKSRENTAVIPRSPLSPEFPELDVPEALLLEEQQRAHTIAGVEGPMIRAKINRALRFQKSLEQFSNDKLGYHLNELKAMLGYAAAVERPKLIDRINAVMKEQAARAKGGISENVRARGIVGDERGFIKVGPDPLEETRIPGTLTPAEEHMLDMVDEKDPATDMPSLVQGWNKVRFHAERFIIPIEIAENMLLAGRTVPHFNSPSAWAQMFSGWSVRAEQMLTDRPMRWGPDGNLIWSDVRGYAPILQDVRGKLNNLRAYEIAVNVLDKAKLGLVSGVDLALATKTIENGTPDIIKAAHESVMFRSAILDYIMDAGGASPDVLRLMVNLVQNNIPLYKLLENKAISPKHLKTVDPIKNTVDFVRRGVRMADRNMVYRRLIELAEENPEVAVGLVEKIEPPKSTVTAADKAKILTNLKKTMAHYGIKATDAVVKELVEHMTAPGLSKKNPSFTFYRNGEAEHWRVHPDIAQALEALTPVEVNWIVQLLSVPARLKRAGIVYHPLFPPIAAMKDAFDVWVRSQYGFTPFDSVLGFGHALSGTGLARILGVTPTEYHRLFKGTGGGFAGLAAVRVQSAEAAYRAVAPTTALSALGTIFHPIELLKGYAAPFDEAARIGELRKAKLSGASDFDAGLASKRAGVDFNMHGASSQALVALTAFLNPTIQSLSADAGAARRNPRRTLLVGMGLFMAAAMIWAMNKDDEQVKEMRTSPAGRPWLWFRDPLSGKIRRVPKPYFWGQVFMTGAEATLDKMEQDDPHAVADWVAAVRQQAEFSINPSILDYARGVWQNQDPFTKAQVVPEEMLGIEPRFQIKPTTSLVAKKAGELFHMVPYFGEHPKELTIPLVDFPLGNVLASPIELDYAINNILGPLGKDVNSAITFALDTKSIAPEPASSEIPFVGRMFPHYPQENVGSMYHFYQSAENYEEINNTLLFLAKNQPEKVEGYIRTHMIDVALAQMYAYGRQEISNLRSAMYTYVSLPQEVATAHEKRVLKDEYTQAMINIAHAINLEGAKLEAHRAEYTKAQDTVSTMEMTGGGQALEGVFQAPEPQEIMPAMP